MAIMLEETVMKESGLYKRRRETAEGLLEQAYFSAARGGEIEVTKSPERERVLRHLLDNVTPHFRPRFLTNPGPMWSFERRVEQEIGEYKAYFVGIERSWQILEWGTRMMPGRQKAFWEVGCAYGDQELSGFITAKAMSCHAHVEGVIGKVRSLNGDKILPFSTRSRITNGQRRPVLHRGTYHKNFKEITACWIDIWSPLGRPEIALMLRNLPWLFARARIPIPFAFTFQYGRDAITFHDAADPLEQRAQMIQAELSYCGGSFDVTDYWWYFGPSESRMATVCGIYRQGQRKR